LRNPFEFGRILSPDELVDRRDELSAVATALDEASKLFLIGPRRYGKTSILHVASLAAEQRGTTVLTYNAESFPTIDALAARLVADAARRLTSTIEKAGAAIATFFAAARPVASFNPGEGTWSITFARDAARQTGIPLLADVLDGVNRAAGKSGRPVAVILDEFQRVIEEGGASAEGQIRAAVQQHRHVGYVFAGSKTRMLADMTGNPNRPFYKLGQVIHLGPVPRADFASFLQRGFAAASIPVETAAIDAILDAADDVPYNVQLLAHACWEACRETGTESPRPLTVALVEQTTVIAALRNDPLYTQLWTSLPATQRKALLAALLESGRGLLTSEVAARYDVLVPSMQRALSALELKGILRQDQHHGHTGLRFEDPQFGTWIRSVVGG
jgi:hypothetical protein